MKIDNDNILKILSFFKKIEKNEKVYLVGGAVRDIILKREPKDLDFAFEGNAISFCEKLNDKDIKNFQILSNKFESCSFFYKNYNISFNSCRRDIYENKLRIERSSILEDLKRRDFTINAMALSLNLNLLDPLDSLKDLLNKKIKIISNESFIEDPSRLIRAVRYRYKLEFIFEKKTEEKFYNSLKLLEKNTRNIRVIKELNRTSNELSHSIIDDKYFREVLKFLNKE